MHPSFMRRSSDGQASQKRNGQGTRHGNHLPSRGLLSHNWENNHGTKIFKEGIGQGRTRDEEAQGRDSEERTIRSQGQAPQAGDRNRSFRGEGGRQEGPEEAFEEKEDCEKAQIEKVVRFNRHCEEPTGPAFAIWRLVRTMRASATRPLFFMASPITANASMPPLAWGGM